MEKDLEYAAKIERQVERWDNFAKAAPVSFLFLSFVILIFDAARFETVFFLGMIFFSITAVIWWFWTIFNIRVLSRLFRKASMNLVEVSNDLKAIREEYKTMRDADNEINNK